MPSPALRTSHHGKVPMDAKMAVEVLEDIADGRTLKEATAPAVPGRIKASTFLRWVMEEPELGEAYRLAREISGHLLEDEALEYARKLPTLSGPAPEMSARIRAYDVAINQLRWSAAKRHPKEYGDKAQTTFTVPIQINTSLPMSPGDAVSPGDLGGQEARGEFVIEVKAEQPPAPPSNPLARSLYEVEMDAKGAEGRRGRGWNLPALHKAQKGKANFALSAAMRRVWERRRKAAELKAEVQNAEAREIPGKVCGGAVEGCGEQQQLGPVEGVEGGEHSTQPEPGVVGQADQGHTGSIRVSELSGGDRGEGEGFRGGDRDTPGVPASDQPETGEREPASGRAKAL